MLFVLCLDFKNSSEYSHIRFLFFLSFSSSGLCVHFAFVAVGFFLLCCVLVFVPVLKRRIR